MTGDKRTVKSARQGYAVANLECATIIATDPERYPAGSLMAVWADAVLSKAAEADVKDQDAGPLFRAA